MGNGHQQTCPQGQVVGRKALETLGDYDLTLPGWDATSVAIDIETNTVFFLKVGYGNGRSAVLVYKNLNSGEEGSIEVSVSRDLVSGVASYSNLPFFPYELHIVKTRGGNRFIVMASEYDLSKSATNPGYYGWGLMVKSYKYEPGSGVQEVGRFGGEVFYGGGPIDSEFSLLLGPNPSGFDIHNVNSVPLDGGYYLVYAVLRFYDKEKSPYLGQEDMDTSVSVYMIFKIEEDGRVRYVDGRHAPAAPINRNDSGWNYYLSALQAGGFHLDYMYTFEGQIVKIANDRNLFLEQTLGMNYLVPTLRLVSLEISETEEISLNRSETIALIDPETLANVRPEEHFSYYQGGWGPFLAAGLVGRNKILLDVPANTATRRRPLPDSLPNQEPLHGLAGTVWVLLDFDEEAFKISVDRFYIHSWFFPFRSPQTTFNVCELEFPVELEDVISDMLGVSKEVARKVLYPCSPETGNQGSYRAEFSSFPYSGYYRTSVPSIKSIGGCYVLPFVGELYIYSREIGYVTLHMFCSVDKAPNSGEPLKINVHYTTPGYEADQAYPSEVTLWLPFPVENKKVAIIRKITQLNISLAD